MGMGMRLRSALFGVALAMVVAGAWLGLAWAPPDREMGDVQRIMYAHVPAVWMALLAVTLNFGCSLAYLLRNKWKMDWMAEASAEVGVLFGAIGVTLGSIWGRPTWGVWWTWDPRLTTAAIMLVSYAGYLALRRFVEDPERRAIWSAVVAIIAYVDVPIIWFSVKWWSSLHQIQSSPKTVDPQMTFVLRWNAFAFLAVLIAFVWSRYRIVRYERERELALPEAYPSPSDGPACAQPSGAVQ
jgi:heme exporter protein C